MRELGLRLLESAGYKGFAQVEFAYDRRDGDYKLLEVNTRVPMWAGVAMTRHFDIARIAYDDLCGRPEPEPVDLQQELWWAFFAKDLSVSLQMARRRELTPARLGAPVSPAAQGARRVRGGRPAAGAGRARLRALEDHLMRIALLDPPSFTVPYDHALASALARRGHDVTLLTAPFTHGDVPEPEGYRREEIFLPVSSRLVRRSPRSRVRLC